MLHGDNPYQPPEAPLGEPRRVRLTRRSGRGLRGERVLRIIALTAIWIIAGLFGLGIADSYLHSSIGSAWAGEAFEPATVWIAACFVLGGIGTVLLALIDYHFRSRHR